MSTLDVVAEVLREVAPRALNARQIVELAAGRLPTASRTPETVVSRDLAMEVKRNGATSRFLRATPGEFLLKEALPTAFFNDVDGYAASWTRNLIKAGELAPGVVDERSIRDLKPADVAGYRQFHAFSGIGVWSRALRDAGWPDDFNVWSGSCPCVPFSSAGRKRGFSDEQHLWPEWFRLIESCRPSIVVGEQVSSKDGLVWLDALRADLEKADYACQAFDLPACGFGAPHRRARLYFVAYARERGREILSAPWLHARRQSGHDALGCLAADGRDASSVFDADGERRERHASSHSAPGNGRSSDGGRVDAAGSLSDAERVVRNEGWKPRPYGWPEVEPDRHSEVDGARGDGDGPVELGDSSVERSGWDAGEVPRAEGDGEGEWVEARDLADEPLASSADDRAVSGEVGMVRGAAGVAGDGFRPGDRIRIDGNPSWGGAVGGFWAVDVEWIYCRPEPGHKDGRWRPIGPGIKPLAFRTSTDLGRTRAKRLRCFGNAIVLPQATAFVGAVIDAFVDASLKERALSPAEDNAVAVAIDVEVAPSPAITPAPAEVPATIGEQPAVVLPWTWTGPREGETARSGMLFGRVPGERWPYGPPSAHESCCNLFTHRGGSPGGLFCDCAASAADDIEYGVG